jgi:hypothetical protein
MSGVPLLMDSGVAADRDLGLGEHEAVKKKMALAVELALADWGSSNGSC